ncbi:MAG: dipeptidase, partial [Rhodothermales bacterium]
SPNSDFTVGASNAALQARADSLIDLVEGITERAPDKFAIARSPADVREQFEQGVISLPLGMENGAPIEEDLAELRYFYDRGIRYITLTHAKDNLISDSSYDSTRTHGGLSDFGRDVVQEMNRIGMIVDVSHISDSAFYQVMETTAAPVMASHSSVRAFTPGFERNMDDAMIQRLAENDGVIMINFGSSFLRGEYQEEGGAIRDSISAFMEENGLDAASPEGIAYFSRQRKANPVGSVDDVVEHINHVVELVGVDHVGLGSDFDGVFALPQGLLDVAYYPNLVYRLLEEGYTDVDIEKILGGNALRVWEAVERVAKEQEERS